MRETTATANVMRAEAELLFAEARQLRSRADAPVSTRAHPCVPYATARYCATLGRGKPMPKSRTALSLPKNMCRASWPLAFGLLTCVSASAFADTGPAPWTFFGRCTSNLSSDDMQWCHGYVDGIADALSNARAVCMRGAPGSAWAAVIVADGRKNERPENFIARVLMRQFPCGRR